MRGRYSGYRFARPGYARFAISGNRNAATYVAANSFLQCAIGDLKKEPPARAALSKRSAQYFDFVLDPVV
jgi:hypothetical protein